MHIWGDLLKLDYGAGPAACPGLWGYMEAYVASMAGLFDGFRLDNLHSTPLHVASHMLKVARQANPRAFVFGELFTGSEERDAEFVKRVGIDCLVREAKNIGSA